MRILFVCSRNRLRSPTAEAVFASGRGVETASAGTAPDAETPLSADLIEWADLIVAMEAVHRRRLKDRFPALLKGKKVAVLGIPDQFDYMESALVDRLREGMKQHLLEDPVLFESPADLTRRTRAADSTGECTSR